MHNDFTGNELHKARRQDLMREAEGGWRLKAAGVNKPSPSIGILLKAIGALLVVLLIAQGLAH